MTAPNRANLFAGVPDELPAELVETLLSATSFRVERIVSRGHASPPGYWCDQAENEWVLLVSGGAHLRFEENSEIVRLAPGDHLLIPARRRHRVEWTAPGVDSVWLAVHFA